MTLPLTTPHARARMQQRGIPPAALAALLDFGSARHLHSKGRELVFFDKKARSRLQRPTTSPLGRRAAFCAPTPSSARTVVITVGLPARDASLAMLLPLDFLLAISPLIVLFVLWVLND